MAMRPNDVWQRQVEEEAAQMAQGTLTPGEMYASTLWPKSLLTSTDIALAAFEDELRTLTCASDADVFDAVKRVVLALNLINEQHGGSGYETGEREELWEYIDASLTAVGIDAEALAARNEIGRWEITDEWRRW
jgi:hypothetical protein